jgi:hypothetical protein
MGLAWLFRRWRKTQPAPAPDPAEELKQKLAESRAEEPEPEPAPPAAEPEPEPEAEPLDSRRRAVHDRARASIDEMRSRGNPPEA